MTIDHVSPRRLSRRTFAAAALAVTALFGTACGSDDPSTTADTSADTTAEGASAAPDKVVIGYQLIPNGDLVVKNQGWLEEAYPDTEIEWKQFDSGGSVNEAFLAGSIDFGLAGSSPVSRGLSNGIDYVVPWIHDVIGEAEALVATADITAVEDLAGKKIATPFASTAHYSLLAALDEAAISDTDVELIDMEPADIVSAWQGDNIDAAYVWNPSLAELTAAGGNVLVTSADLAERGTTTYDLAVVSAEFAEDYPAFVTDWVALQSRAVELYRADPDAWAEAAGAELNLDAADVLEQAADLIFLNAEEQTGADALGGGLLTNLFAAAEFNFEQGQIDELADKARYETSITADFAANAGK